MADQFSINADTPVELLVEKYPKAVGWLSQRGIVCIKCGEPYWGSLGELMEKKNIENPNELIAELRSELGI